MITGEVITMEMGPGSQKAKNTIGPDLKSFLGISLSALNSINQSLLESQCNTCNYRISRFMSAGLPSGTLRMWSRGASVLFRCVLVCACVCESVCVCVCARAPRVSVCVCRVRRGGGGGLSDGVAVVCARWP